VPLERGGPLTTFNGQPSLSSPKSLPSGYEEVDGYENHLGAEGFTLPGLDGGIRGSLALENWLAGWRESKV
jgi:hypothetical protein